MSEAAVQRPGPAFEQNTAFSSKSPRLQLAWDSMSIGALKKCFKYYQYTMIEGWVPRQRNFHLHFGIVYHGATERYEHAKAQGTDHEEAVDVAVAWALKETWDSTLKRPWISGDNAKNRFTLLRTIVWYLDQFKEDPLKTIILADGRPAIELSFRYPPGIETKSGEEILLSGHLDRVASLNDDVFISDKKTTGHTIDDNYWTQFSPDVQFSNYTLAGKVVWGLPIQGIIVDAAQVAVTFSRFQRGLVKRTDEQLEEWFEDLKVLLRWAEVAAETNHYPLNDKACFRCDFRAICARSPQVREKWLEATFMRRVWDPLVARGDI